MIETQEELKREDGEAYKTPKPSESKDQCEQLRDSITGAHLFLQANKVKRRLDLVQKLSSSKIIICHVLNLGTKRGFFFKYCLRKTHLNFV